MQETMAVGCAMGIEFPSDFSAELDRLIAAFCTDDEGFNGE
jgi:hypothetical protein